MRTHGSESYWILGEGLVSVSGDGRPASPPPAVPGAAAGLPPCADETPAFRFSRMGPKESPLSMQNTARSRRAMIASGGGAAGRASRPATPTWASSSTTT